MRMSRAVLLPCAAVLAGCASQPEVLRSHPLWPFEQLEIRTSVGTVHSYVSRPQSPAKRIVIALQASPCRRETHEAEQHVIGTSGLIWEQFKEDSLFVQFERPGGGQEPNSIVVACARHGRDDALDTAHVAVREAISAVRQHERLKHVPAAYVGIGRGAHVALTTAARDKNATVVALVSAIVDSELQQMVAGMQWRSGAHVPSIVIVHAQNDTRTSLAKASALHDALRARNAASSLLIVEQTSFDFGLSAHEPECFDVLARILGQRLRAPPPSASDTHRVRCPSASLPADSNDFHIETIERL